MTTLSDMQLRDFAAAAVRILNREPNSAMKWSDLFAQCLPALPRRSDSALVLANVLTAQILSQSGDFVTIGAGASSYLSDNDKRLLRSARLAPRQPPALAAPASKASEDAPPQVTTPPRRPRYSLAELRSERSRGTSTTANPAGAPFDAAFEQVRLHEIRIHGLPEDEVYEVRHWSRRDTYLIPPKIRFAVLRLYGLRFELSRVKEEVVGKSRIISSEQAWEDFLRKESVDRGLLTISADGVWGSYNIETLDIVKKDPTIRFNMPRNPVELRARVLGE